MFFCRGVHWAITQIVISDHVSPFLAHNMCSATWVLICPLPLRGQDVFERRTSTGSEVFSLFICLDANKLVLLSFFSLLKTIYPRVSTKPLPNDAKSPLPADVRCTKTLLLKLPNMSKNLDITKRLCSEPILALLWALSGFHFTFFYMTW